MQVPVWSLPVYGDKLLDVAAGTTNVVAPATAWRRRHEYLLAHGPLVGRRPLTRRLSAVDLSPLRGARWMSRVRNPALWRRAS